MGVCISSKRSHLVHMHKLQQGFLQDRDLEKWVSKFENLEKFSRKKLSKVFPNIVCEPPLLPGPHNDSLFSSLRTENKTICESA